MAGININTDNCRCEVEGRQCLMKARYPLRAPRFCYHHKKCTVDHELKLFSQHRQKQVKQEKQRKERDPRIAERQRAELEALREQERRMIQRMNQDPEMIAFRAEMRRKRQRGEKK